MEVPAPSYSHLAASPVQTWKHAGQPNKTPEICTKCSLFPVLKENSVQFTRQGQGDKIVGNPVYNENRKKVAFARPQQKLKVIHLPLLYPQTFFCKERQECEAGLVYRSYCIDTTTVYSPNLVKVSTYQRPRHLLPHRAFFWTPWAPRRLGTNVADVVESQVQLCQRFVHLEGLSDGLRLRRPADQAFHRGRCQAFGSYGMHLLLWVGEPKVTTELVDVDYRWVFLAWLRQDSFKLWQGNK